MAHYKSEVRDGMRIDWDVPIRMKANKYQNWETPDPERWVPDGYVCVRVDSRGSGRSPGYLDIFSPRETQDYFECIASSCGKFNAPPLNFECQSISL